MGFAFFVALSPRWARLHVTLDEAGGTDETHHTIAALAAKAAGLRVTAVDVSIWAVEGIRSKVDAAFVADVEHLNASGATRSCYVSECSTTWRSQPPHFRTCAPLSGWRDGWSSRSRESVSEGLSTRSLPSGRPAWT